MSFLRSLATDLRERQVLPAVVLLVILVVGIPIYATVALSKSSTPTPISPPVVDTAPPAGTPAPTPELALVQAAPAQSHTLYKGTEPNPLSRAGSTPPKTTPPPAKTTPTPAATTTPTVTTTTPPATHPTTTTTHHYTTPKSAPSSLSSNEAYEIAAVSTYGDQKDTLDNLQRLSPLPANVNAELVYLGVLKGGKQAVFLLTGAVPTTLTGTTGVKCVPSSSDCQVIELAVGDQLTLTPTSGAAASTFTFKLSSIGAQKFSSSSAAKAARASTSAAGQVLISQSTSMGLASFFYDSGIGALLYESSTGSTSSTGAIGTAGN
jgi:hypothetical protein